MGSVRYAQTPPIAKYLTYTIRSHDKRPRSGVNSLAPTDGHVYTAGRDGVARCWRSDISCEPEAAFDEHADWVNDVILMQGTNRLVTASSDTTVKVWNTADSRVSLRTLDEHQDYVKALAPLADNAVVSGALDGRVLIWDLVTGKMRDQCGGERGGTVSSVYCLASCSGTEMPLVTSGSTDRMITVYDARSCQSVVRLRGHTDGVRCLKLKHDGMLLLSGSSDATVRLWDMRQQRCVRTYDSHASDSVWALDAPRAFESFVSGGRDGTVWHTSLHGDVTSLVAEERGLMVLDVSLCPSDESRVWVSTTGSTVRQWPLFSADAGEARHMDLHPVTGREHPLLELEGIPAIVAYRIMNNRRHIMTCDACNEVCVWDVTSASRLKSLGKLPDGMDFDEMLEKNDEHLSVPSWFKVDIRLGYLSIKLAKSSVGDAEVYAVDVGFDAETDDVKINIGDHVLRGLLSTWKAKMTSTKVVDVDPESSSTPAWTALKPYAFPPDTMIVLSNDSPVPILAREVGLFDGESEASILPPWAVDVVLHGNTMGRDQAPKVGFTLYPVDGSGLPDLQTVNLTAPQVLRIRKVAGYVATQLSSAMELKGDERLEAHHIDILCLGKLVPPTMNLATAKKFRWQSEGSGDLKLLFRKSAETPEGISAAVASAAAAAQARIPVRA